MEDIFKLMGFENEDQMFTLNKLGEDLEVFNFEMLCITLKKLSTIKIMDTYLEEIIFESDNGDIYELALL